MRWPAPAVALLLLAWPVAADMYQDGSNAKLPEARKNLGSWGGLDVTQFGCVGDSNYAPGNGTDNTSCIRDAIAAARATLGRAVRFPGGSYRFTDTIDSSGVTIQCDGNNNTFLWFDDTTTTKDGMTVGHNNFNMYNCRYDRAQLGTAGALLHFTDSYHVEIASNILSNGNAWNVITIDSATNQPNQIFIHDNRAFNVKHNFLFSNSTNSALPVFDVHLHNNFVYGNHHALVEIAGYGQVDAHDNVVGGASPTYSIYIHPPAPHANNQLSFIQNNVIDAGPVSVANFNNMLISGNNIQSLQTYATSTGIVYTGNQMACSACGVTIQGVGASRFSGNHFNGTVTPFKVEPGGGAASADLDITGNSWVNGGGAFLTFSGTPVANNVRAGVALQGNEVLATFATAPTNFRNVGDTSGPGNALSFSACTGTGATGACSVAGTNERGVITLTTAGGGTLAAGDVHMTFAGTTVGPTGSVCTVTPANGASNWALPVGVTVKFSATNALGFSWTNGGGAALTNASTYKFGYACAGY